MFPLEMSTSFTAQLMCLSNNSDPQPVRMIASTSGDFLTGVGIADTGWLCLPEQSNRHTTTALHLRFDFIEQVEARTHFKVTCASRFKDYLGTYLDTSRNGYLGFYEGFSPHVFWKTEEVDVYTGYGDLRPAFKLRDHNGSQVRYKWKENVRYLNSDDDSEPLIFTLADYQPL